MGSPRYALGALLALVIASVLGVTGSAPTSASDPPTGVHPEGVSASEAWNVELVSQVSGGSVYAVAVRGGYAYIGLGTELAVLDVSDPAHPSEVGQRVPLSYATGSIALSGNLAFVTTGAGGLRIFDVSNPAQPVAAGSWYGHGLASFVAAAGAYAYLIDNGFYVVNATNPAGPVLAGSYLGNGNSAYYVTLVGGYAYLASGTDGLYVLDVSNLANVHEVSHLDTPGWAVSVAVAGNYAYVCDAPIRMGGLTDADDHFRVVDVSDLSHPTEIGSLRMSDQTPGPRTVVIDGHLAYLADRLAGLRVIDVSNPAVPSEVGYYDTPGEAGRVVVANGYAYVADGTNGLLILRLSAGGPPPTVTSTPTATSTSTPTPTVTPTPTSTPTSTPTWAPTQVTISRGSGSRELVSNNGSVRLVIPESALPGSVFSATLRFSPAPPSPTPGVPPVGKRSAIPVTAAFDLSAWEGSGRAPIDSLAAPLTLTVRYVGGSAFVERGVALHRRSSVDETWTTDGLVAQSVNTASNLVSGQVISLGQFIVLAPPAQRVYLPIAARESSGW